MSVWLTIPSARPAAIAAARFRLWRQQGYHVSVWRDTPQHIDYADVVTSGAYPGYAQAVNTLIRDVTARDPEAAWFVIGGDDVSPDLTHSADAIAAECAKYFRELHWPKHWAWDAKYKGPTAAKAAGAYAELKPQALWSQSNARAAETFGVMQPTGDRWGDSRGAYIDRVAGSAWIGREFAETIYDGKGPLWPEYQHMFVDEELQAVAEKYSAFWQRPDLVQHHEHCLRRSGLPQDLEPHLAKWNTREHWNESKALFERRKAAGFPDL